MQGLKGKLVIVTGAANGLGEAACRSLASYGALIIGVDRDSSIRRLQNEAVLSTAICLDLAANGAIEAMCDEWTFFAADKELWGIVNVPCTPVFKTLDTDAADWELAIRTSVGSYAAIVSAMLPHFSREGGSIVNMGSVSAHVAQRGYGTYSASKAAVISYSRCLALELAERNIRVNTVSPGTIWTANNAKHIKADWGLDREGAEADERFGGRVPLRRCGEPAEVGEAIAFLVSTSAAFITGHDLVVDGGFTLV